MEQAPKALTFVDVIVANDQQPGSIGVYGQHRSSVGSGGSGWTYGVDVVAPVRIVEVLQDSEWPLCDFEPLAVSTDVIGDELRARLLEAFANYARAWHLPAADFQIARMDYLSDDRAMTNALIGLLTPGAGQTAWLLAANNRERAEALLQQLGG